MRRALGIGQIQNDMIDLAGAAIDELRVDFKPAEYTVGFADVLVPGLLLKLLGWGV